MTSPVQSSGCFFLVKQLLTNGNIPPFFLMRYDPITNMDHPNLPKCGILALRQDNAKVVLSDNDTVADERPNRTEKMRLNMYQKLTP